jgi:hypothetical protein
MYLAPLYGKARPAQGIDDPFNGEKIAAKIFNSQDFFGAH